MRRISAKVRQRKRQTWLDVPASGLEEVGHGRRTRADGGSQEASREARESGSEGRRTNVT